MSLPRLESWSAGRDPYKAPEISSLVLHGRVYGHDTFTDGETIITAGVTVVDGRAVTVADGHTFKLGEPARDYVDWMANEGIPFDPENPARIVKVAP